MMILSEILMHLKHSPARVTSPSPYPHCQPPLTPHPSSVSGETWAIKIAGITNGVRVKWFLEVIYKAARYAQNHDSCHGKIHSNLEKMKRSGIRIPVRRESNHCNCK